MTRGRKMHRLAMLAALAVGCSMTSAPPLPLAPPPSSLQTAPSTLQPTVAARYNADSERVSQIGQRLLQANPGIALKPAFTVTGSPHPEVSHQGDRNVYISAGMVGQCLSDGQLAAILSVELAKMVGERLSREDIDNLRIDRELPVEVRIGPDGGSFGAADQIHKAEIAMLGYDRRKPRAATARPDTMSLARQYLTRAGYPATELETIARTR